MTMEIMGQTPETADKGGVETKPNVIVGRHRLQLDFSPEAFAQLENIRMKAGTRTNAEVVRNALRIYEWFLDQKVKGAQIQVKQGTTTREVELLF